MILSDEQMRAVNHGYGPEPTYEWVDLPVGPQPLSFWAKGLHINFMVGYCNTPHYTIKATAELRSWPNKRFHKDGSRYMAVSDDGRAEVYYHDGPISMTPIRRFRAADGTIRKFPKRFGSHWDDLEPGEWVDVPMLATTQQQGFGGSHYDLQMDDGTVVVLRGPWHGGAPSGFVECAYVFTDRTFYKRRKKRWARDIARRPWWKETATGGVFVTEDLFMRILARFAPECRCARVTESGTSLLVKGVSKTPASSHLEAVHGMWSAPKQWVGADRWSYAERHDPISMRAMRTS